MKPKRARMSVVIEWDDKAKTDEKVEANARKAVNALMSPNPRRLLAAVISIDGLPEKPLT